LMISFSCQRTTKLNKTTSSNDSIIITEQTDTKVENIKTIELNGVFEFIYPHNTTDLIENHYIAFKTIDNKLFAWYYGTSDDFDEAREGYLPGFFVSKLTDLQLKNDSISFSITLNDNDVYSKSIKLGDIDNGLIRSNYSPWEIGLAVNKREYKGKIVKDSIILQVENEDRVFNRYKDSFELAKSKDSNIRCNSEVLLNVAENIDSLDKNIIKDFLMTFSKDCENNAEFSQWSNELLFKVLLNYPKSIILILETDKSDLEKNIILQMLRNPNNDLIDIGQIMTEIEKVNIDNQTKLEIMNILKTIKY